MLFVNIIKPTHICNLACTYCYNDDVREPIMRDDTLRRTIGQTFQYVRSHAVFHSVDFIWHGGEPTVPGLGFYRRVVELQQELCEGVPYGNSLQTNGLLINEAWIDFIKRSNFTVSISIDGPKSINDTYRVTHQGKGSYDRVFRAIERMKAAQIPFGACMVLSKATASHAVDILNFFSSEGLPFNVIPMTRSGMARDRYDEIGLDAEEYADAWIPMYDAWLESGDREDYVYIQDFVLKTRAIVYGKSSDCIGMANCSHFNISTDPIGDVYPCASLSGNAGSCYGNVNQADLTDLLATPTAAAFKNRGVDPQCEQCKWQHVCHGGCASRAYKFHGDINCRDYYCPSLFRIYEHIERRLRERGCTPGSRHPLHMSDGIDQPTYRILAPPTRPSRSIPIAVLT